jgi:hypothetical protein
MTTKKTTLKKKIKKKYGYKERRSNYNSWSDVRGEKLLSTKEFKKYLAEGGI